MGIGMNHQDHQRAAFIAHFKALLPLWQFQDDGFGGFHNQCTAWAWSGWQAARADAVPAAGEELPFDPGYVHAYLTAAMKEMGPDGLIDPQVAYLLEWLAEGGADGVPACDDTLDTNGHCGAEGGVCPHVSKCNANNGCIAGGVSAGYQSSDGIPSEEKFTPGVTEAQPDLLKLVQEYGTARYSEGVNDALRRPQLASQSHAAAKDRLADIELTLRARGVMASDGSQPE
jgi:hypothetical protein